MPHNSLAPTEYPVHELIARRRSPRDFIITPISQEDLWSILEAARWAPSCFNEQPWRFLVAHREDSEDFERLLTCLVEANQAWCCRASALILCVAKHDYTLNGLPNDWAVHDVGIAVGYMALQAVAIGHFTHAMAGFDKKRAREVCEIPEGFAPVTMVAIGKAPEPDVPLERSRKPAETNVFTSIFGDALNQKV